nr:MAG TPA: hypothetical protein [Caudoviricetes sp.]
MTLFPVHPSNFPYIFGIFRLFSVFLTLPLLCHSFYTFTTTSIPGIASAPLFINYSS